MLPCVKVILSTIFTCHPFSQRSYSRCFRIYTTSFAPVGAYFFRANNLGCPRCCRHYTSRSWFSFPTTSAQLVPALQPRQHAICKLFEVGVDFAELLADLACERYVALVYCSARCWKPDVLKEGDHVLLGIRCAVSTMLRVRDGASSVRLRSGVILGSWADVDCKIVKL